VSALYLIRHGQASYGEADYDALSAIGVRQAEQLGAWWAAHGATVDAVYVGPRQRQIDTARHILDAVRSAGLAWPEATTLDAFDEYPAFELLRYWLPILQAEDRDFQALMAAAATRSDRAHILDTAFQFIIGKWSLGELDVAHLETFAAFIGRVERGLSHLAEAHPARRTDGNRVRVAVITSGGPIAVAMRIALGLDDETTLRVGSVVRNASFSEFRNVPASRPLTMIGFNATPHLVDKVLFTYR
jgi:broad specificity phosphatase PhoE